jgi:hypothetical protein
MIISRNQRLIITFLISVLILGNLCCSSISNKYPPGDFHALVISDTHISNDEAKVDRLNTLIDKVDTGEIPGIAFIVNTGDVVSSVYRTYDARNPDENENRLKKLVRVFEGFTIPYYFVMGNHDYKIHSDRDSDAPFKEDEILFMEKIWKETTGFDPYYAYKYMGWKFIVLNSMRGRYLQRHFDEKQMDWFESELCEQIPTILFFHHPLETDHFRIWCGFKSLITPDLESRFFSLLETHEEIIKGIFVGHGHCWVCDVLYEKIGVYETDSFGDESDYPYLVIGFDNSEKEIQVGKMPIPID